MLGRHPKVYGFNTSFVAFTRGWTQLRPEDSGSLWVPVVSHRSEDFAHPSNRWLSHSAAITFWITDVKIWKLK